jgi:hypothetical protein
MIQLLQSQQESSHPTVQDEEPQSGATPNTATYPESTTDGRGFNPFEADFLPDIPDDARFDARELRRQTMNLWARAEQSGISRMAEHLDNRELADRITFEANVSDVFEFLQRVDGLRIDMEWDDATTLRTLKKALCPTSRDAVQVANLRRAREGKGPMDYLQTKSMMCKAYGNGISESEYYLRQYERFRQLSQEPVESAALRFEGVVFRLERACPERAPPAHSILRTFRHGLQKDLQHEISGYADLQDLTLPKLVREAARLERALAKRRETSRKDTKPVAANVTNEGVNKCAYCKKKGHGFGNCRVRLRLCFKCGKEGHQISTCPEMPSDTANKPATPNYASPHQTDHDKNEDTSNPLQESGPAIARFRIGDTTLPALLDTGSGMSFISREYFDRIIPPLPKTIAPEPMEVGDAFGRQNVLQQRATVILTLNDHQLGGVRLWVAEKLAAGLLLGRDFLVQAKAKFDYETGWAYLGAFDSHIRIANRHSDNDGDDPEDCLHLSPMGPVPPAVKDMDEGTDNAALPIGTLSELQERMAPDDDDDEARKARNDIAKAIWMHHPRLLDERFGDTRHFIRLPVRCHRPIARKPHPVSCKEREVIRNEMRKLEEQGVIERTISPWAAPVLIVPKANGKLRPCVDYRALNEVLTSNAYPVPNAKNILQNLRGATYCTVIDIRGAFWNLWVHPEDRDKTAFVTPDAQYRYLRMPMGITPGPAEWQAYMDKVLLPVSRKGVFAYLDDIIICPNGSAEEHASVVNEVLDLLDKQDLRIQPEKCQWLVKQARYLGHVVSKTGIHVQDDKVAAVTEYPTPVKVKDVRAFLGLTSYYRAFMPRYSTVAAPLHQLLKKDQPFSWGPKEESAFETLKKMLTSAPVLEHYDPSNRDLILQTDASNVGVSAVLTQRDENG